jgi:cellulose synthase operon protein B
MKKRFFHSKPGSSLSSRTNVQLLRSFMLCGMGVLTSLVVLLSGTGVAQVLTSPSDPPTAQESVEAPQAAPRLSNPREQAAGEAETPTAPTTDRNDRENPPRKANMGPLSQYILEFNRSPEIGNRFRIEGVYGESRLGFTRPKGWNMKTVKAIVRFQHSPNLVPARSNLVVRVNDTSVGSVPLNLKNSQVGEAVFAIPGNLVQDYNEISLVAQQENSPSCSNPNDQNLWTEILPDSKIVFDYQPEEIPLSFGSYPYPFFDELGLEATRLNYLMPTQVDESWLTAASRFQTQMGRLADFRPLETQLVKEAKSFRWNDRLIIIGTPEQQPILKTLKLPVSLNGNQFIDRDKTAFGDDTGLLMLTSLQEGAVPVLVISGNSETAVRKAAQFLVQPQSSQIGTSTFIAVNDLASTKEQGSRDWPRFLPERKQFTLKDLQGSDGKPYRDVTVKGSNAPPINFNFWALPDDRFKRGSSMTLHYTYGAQADPKNSTISVAIDGVNIGSKRLASDQGGSRETFTVDLPENLITPTSKIRVDFKLQPKDADPKRDCGRLTDQHLTGTLHGDTSFNLNREIGADLPNLKLFTSGFPFANVQNLSNTAILVPETPNAADLMTMLKFSERMGRLTRANSVQHEVYRANNASADMKKYKNLVAVGTRERLPLPEVFQADKGFNLNDAFKRQIGQTQIQTLPNADGIIKTVISPWNKDRVLLALSAQSEQGLKQVQDVLSSDAWFYQLQGDTALMSPTEANPNPFDPNGYRFQFLQESTPQTRENINFINKIQRFLKTHFYLLPIGIIVVSLLMYGIAQKYLKRVAAGGN